jgi:pimeloyl-ACP methyl ester carboxylesterase
MRSETTLKVRRALMALAVLALAGCASVPGKHTAQIEGRRIEVVRRGAAQAGTPTVVFESGLGFGASHWDKVMDALEQGSTPSLFAYSRPGYGASQSASGPRDPATIARQLHALLAAAQVRPPYVLVGHSLGGVYVQTFAALYPAETAGLVLVDPTHPRQWRAMNERAPRDAKLVSAVSIAFSTAMRREFEASKDEVAALAEKYHGPVVLLAAKRPDATSSAEFIALRRDLLEEMGRIYSAPPRWIDASHNIHRDDPGTVAAAIRGLLPRSS